MGLELSGTGAPHSHPEQKLENLRNATIAVQKLSVRQRQILHFITRSTPISEIAAILNIKQQAVRAILSEIREILGITDRADLVRVALLSQVRWNATPALALYEWTYNNLIGAKIVGAVVQDEDWFGLILEMQNKEQRVAWFINDIDGDQTSGWIELE